MAETCIALLRAVNVGGNHLLPMKEFVHLLESMGLTNVRTYIQSGNAVFQTKKSDVAVLAGKIKSRIKRDHGFAPETVVLTLNELKRAVAANPYPQADANPQSLHLVFLDSAPKKPDLAALEKLKQDSEHFALKGKAFYFYAPDGVGRSRLFARIEKSLGVTGTARNWRTVRCLLEMAQEVAAADAQHQRRSVRSYLRINRCKCLPKSVLSWKP